MSTAMKPSAVVLLSSGLDSTFNLYEALHRGWRVPLAITFNYGQRAALREIEHSQKLCRELGVSHKVVEVPFFREFTSTALVNPQAAIPAGADVDISNLRNSEKTAERVWVPNRNGILLNIAAGFAEGLGVEAILPGFNAEEAATFPDNTDDFMKALDGSFRFSTANHVKVVCFSSAFDKTEIVKQSQKLKIPFKDLWPCYFDQPEICRRCESCQRFLRALKLNGVTL